MLALDGSNFPNDMGLHVNYSRANGTELFIRTHNQLIAADSVKAVWVRRFNAAQSRFSQFDASANSFATAESQMMVDSLVHLWPDSSPWVSKPRFIYRACNKPYNLMMAERAGFTVPETAFSNDVAFSRKFLETHDPVAMKTFSTLWMKDSMKNQDADPTKAENDETLTVFYVKKYKAQELLANIANLPYCPVIFQEYIPKALELRVNVVGDKVLTCAIYSQEQEDNREDYRVHWTNNLRLEPYILPAEVEQRCHKLVKSLELDMGCIDLILTPEGDFVYLEINPVGQWIWVEERTGLPIAESIAELLINKAQQSRS